MSDLRRPVTATEPARVIRILGLINETPTGFDGQWLVDYDPAGSCVEPLSGKPFICKLVTTPNLDEARRFGVAEAWEVWRAVDPTNPLRPDGQPNRPLTAFSVLFEAPEEADANTSALQGPR